jgi:hypothetical protein
MPKTVSKPGLSTQTAGSASWSTWREAVGICRDHLRGTLLTALAVGTVLFAINQLDVVVGGHATTGTIVKIALTYVVPFAVANFGVLMATKLRD